MIETTRRDAVRAEWIKPNREVVEFGNDRFRLRLTFSEAHELAGILGVDGFPEDVWRVGCGRFEVEVIRAGDRPVFANVRFGNVTFALDIGGMTEWRDQLRCVLRLSPERGDAGGLRPPPHRDNEGGDEDDEDE
jgi:hypothetical protein